MLTLCSVRSYFLLCSKNKMAKTIFQSETVFLLAALVLLNFVSFCSAKQPIRLQNGLECTEPGYFRDVENCKKFYYCPFPMTTDKEPILTEKEKVEWKKFIINGMNCPKGSFFDETTSFCESLHLAAYIPPECDNFEEKLDHFEYFRDSTTDNIPEMLRNNQ